MARQITGIAAVLALVIAFLTTSLAGARADPMFGLSGPAEDAGPLFQHRQHGPLPRADELPFDSAPLLPSERPKPPAVTEEEAPPPDPPKPPTREEMLNRLFARLAKAQDPDEASGIAALIDRLWMRSGSDTADLLMTRAMAALGSSHRDVALALLDKVIQLDPDWAEAWNKRATIHFLEDDDSHAMEDIGHTLALEPRHYGALSGMGFILKRNGLDKAALTALRRAQAIYPENPDIKKAVDDLALKVEGRDL